MGRGSGSRTVCQWVPGRPVLPIPTLPQISKGCGDDELFRLAPARQGRPAGIETRPNVGGVITRIARYNGLTAPILTILRGIDTPAGVGLALADERGSNALQVLCGDRRAAALRCPRCSR